MSKLVVANWKMKLSLEQAVALAQDVSRLPESDCDVVVCPSFLTLSTISEDLEGSRVKLGAQDCFWEQHGAFTGEVSPQNLVELGCEYVILGHSERRHYLAETDAMVHAKAVAALTAGLTPIICVGETYDQRQEGSAEYAIIDQVTKAVQGLHLSPKQRVVIAYEPVWVIGTGRAIDPAEAQRAHQVIHQMLIDIFPADVVEKQFKIIYGGSVDALNVSSFTELEYCDGVLVGNASLDSNAFSALINAV